MRAYTIKTIKIYNINDIKEFIRHSTAVDGEVTCSKGKYMVDGKSIMGLMSIDLSTGITVEYPEDATDFDEFVSQFEV